ncbi:hypothetical protein PMIN02_004825 [Paraphaeosphaeria minitans]
MSVTAPFNANSPPFTVTPAFTEIEADARMLPAKTVAVPSVAEVPTCQKTLHACAPLMRMTDEAVAVVRVDPIWKTKTVFGSFCASRTSVPVKTSTVRRPGIPTRLICGVVGGVDTTRKPRRKPHDGGCVEREDGEEAVDDGGASVRYGGDGDDAVGGCGTEIDLCRRVS